MAPCRMLLRVNLVVLGLSFGVCLSTRPNAPKKSFIFVGSKTLQNSLKFMNFPFFIARRITQSRQSAFSALIIKVAIVAVALSLAVMLLATAMVRVLNGKSATRFLVFKDILVLPISTKTVPTKIFIPLIRAKNC